MSKSLKKYEYMLKLYQIQWSLPDTESDSFALFKCYNFTFTTYNVNLSSHMNDKHPVKVSRYKYKRWDQDFMRVRRFGIMKHACCSLINGFVTRRRRLKAYSAALVFLACLNWPLAACLGSTQTTHTHYHYHWNWNQTIFSSKEILNN